MQPNTEAPTRRTLCQPMVADEQLVRQPPMGAWPGGTCGVCV